MLTRNEAERLAAAIHSLRPDWPVSSLVTFLGKRQKQPLLDLTVQLAWVAQLPESKTPARIDEDGPWKSAVRGAEPINTTSLLPKPDFETGCSICLRPTAGHDDTDHTFTRPARVPMPEHIRQIANAATTQEDPQ